MVNKPTFWWKDFLKGVLIGLGMLAPGLSGGVFAVALGVYPRIIHGINRLWKRPIDVVRDLIWLAIGGVIGLFITFYTILALIEYAPLPFTLLFVGFIIGSIPHVIQKQRHTLHLKRHLLITLVTATIIMSLPFLPRNNYLLNDINVQTTLTLFLVGLILAGTLVIPGISGSLVLLVMGFYVYLFETAKLFIDRLLTFEIPMIFEAAIPLIIVGLGLIIGVILFAYVLGWLLKQNQPLLYSGVLGLLIASPFAIILEAFETYSNISDGLGWSIPLSIILFIAGLVGGFIVQEKDGAS